jgi:hypothetical protein
VFEAFGPFPPGDMLEVVHLMHHAAGASASFISIAFSANALTTDAEMNFAFNVFRGTDVPPRGGIPSNIDSLVLQQWSFPVYREFTEQRNWVTIKLLPGANGMEGTLAIQTSGPIWTPPDAGGN